jgi:hypothetical protein
MPLSFCRPLTLVLLALLSSPNLLAQIVNISNSTVTPTAGVGRDYIKELQETVDPASDGLSLRIGIPVPPGRGLTLPFAFSYDSNSVSLNMATQGHMQWGYNHNLLAFGPWSNTLPCSAPRLSSGRIRANSTGHAMPQQAICFRTPRAPGELYGNKATMSFGPFTNAQGGKVYLTVAP